jgi:hypothetical protein
VIISGNCHVVGVNLGWGKGEMESLFWYGDLLENSHLDDEEILGNNIKKDVW